MGIDTAHRIPGRVEEINSPLANLPKMTFKTTVAQSPKEAHRHDPCQQIRCPQHTPFCFMAQIQTKLLCESI